MVHRTDAQHGMPAVDGATHLASCKVEQWPRRRAAVVGPCDLDRNDRRENFWRPKIVCSSNDLCGSWAKAETPFPPEFLCHFDIGTVGDHRLKVASIVRVATKTFAGDVGDFGV